MENLKKCPFCGGKGKVTKTHGSVMFPYVVVCEENECSASVGIFKATREEAIQAWNNRATEAELRANVIDEFAEAIKTGLDKKYCFGGIDARFQFFDTVDEIALQMKGEKE